MDSVMYSSKTGEWSTPQSLFDELDAEFHFTVDVAANDWNHKCDRYYTSYQDGLKQNWKGETVFCNPPYGKALKDWAQKAYESADDDTTVVMLVPARTDTAWFHDWVYGKAEIRFIRGRVNFGGGDRAPFPSMIAVFGGKKNESL